MSRATTPKQVAAEAAFDKDASMPARVPSLLDLALSASAFIRANRASKRCRFNPNPRGNIQPGSVTAVVLEFLRGAEGWKCEEQIRHATGRRHGAVSWSLCYLRAHGLIEAVPDDIRRAGYMRYRAMGGPQIM